MDAARTVAALRAAYPNDKPSDIYFTAATEASFRTRAIAQAERKAAQGGAPAYMYLLNWETPVAGGKWKSPHALEIGMVFDNVAKSESMSGVGPVQQSIADAMSGAWLRFAKTATPAGRPIGPRRARPWCSTRPPES
jgi:para-nitrobenzyl esterase